MNGALQGVRIAVGKHPSQLWVLLQEFLHFLDLLLHGGRGEEAVLYWRTLRFVLAIHRCHHLGIACVDIHLGILLSHRCHGGKKSHC